MTESVFVPDMILGVWISTKPFLVRVSLKSWQTPDCSRKMAWLVVVFEREHTQKELLKLNLGITVKPPKNPKLHQLVNFRVYSLGL